MKEKDLNIYDVWKSPNGNLFIKMSEDYSIAIGPKGHHGPSPFDKGTSYVKRNDVTTVKKVGRIKFKK